MIDFTLSPQQVALRKQASDFATNVLSTAPSTYEQLSTQISRFRSTRPLYHRAVAQGLIKGLVPPDLGGTAGSLIDTTILVEELYTVETSVTLTILSTGLGLSPLIAGGTTEQKKEFLRPFLSGEGEPLASLVLSEPGGSANWLEIGGKGLQTVAWKEETTGDWVISGEKVGRDHQ
jgi:alkylation response protein AidB-like acyl-CoA dehydrogenase